MGRHIKQLAPDLQCDLLALHESHPQRYPYLLESVAHGTPQGRYDILFALPQTQLILRKEGLFVDGRHLDETAFLPTLDRLWQAEAVAHCVPPLATYNLPFYGGWFIYMGYELAAQIEPSLSLPDAPDDLPLAMAQRIPAALIRDHKDNSLYLVAEEAETLIDIEAELTVCQGSEANDGATALPPFQLQEEAVSRHLQVVDEAKRYIIDGDIFQANLSRRWTLRFGSKDVPKASALYRNLRRHNPAPFAGLALMEGGAVISSSPERLVSCRHGHVETRPIAGTRPRGDSDSDDMQKARELIGHPKERAEHIMLIDLERNDLGRICRPGTVKVDELMALESYAHVHHIVSNVSGELREGVSPGEVIAAVFPGGTITGCPKVRCMEIIAELEGEGRGAYTGSMGYLNHNGDMDLNILIRTLVQSGEQLFLRAGGGIVADSDAEAELRETRAKARGLLLSLGLGSETDGVA